MILFFLATILLIILQGIIIKNNKFFLTLTFVELLLISGMRVPDGDGSDTRAYCDTFLELSTMSPTLIIESFEYEIGFYLMCHYLSYISRSPQILLFVSSLIMTTCVFRFIYTKSKIPWISVILYITLQFFFGNLNLMRFGLATSILLLSIDYVINRKPIKFFMVIGVASLFHFSSLMFCIIYFLYSLKLNKKNLIVISLPFFAISYAFFSVFSFLIIYNSRYTSYDTGNGDFSQSSYANYLIVVFNVLILLFLYKNSRKPVCQLEGYEKLYFLMTFISCIFSVMAINVMMITRFITMFSIVEIVYVPNILHSMSRKQRQKWTIIIIVSTIIQLIVILTYRAEWYFVNPYKNLLLL